MLCKDGVIRPEDLPGGMLQSVAAAEPAAAGDRTLREVERRHIRAVLASVQGNRTRAAQILGISPATLWRRLRES